MQKHFLHGNRVYDGTRKPAMCKIKYRKCKMNDAPFCGDRREEIVLRFHSRRDNLEALIFFFGVCGRRDVLYLWRLLLQSMRPKEYMIQIGDVDSLTSNVGSHVDSCWLFGSSIKDWTATDRRKLPTREFFYTSPGRLVLRFDSIFCLQNTGCLMHTTILRSDSARYLAQPSEIGQRWIGCDERDVTKWSCWSRAAK